MPSKMKHLNSGKRIRKKKLETLIQVLRDLVSCPICYQPMSTAIGGKCGHFFCSSCIAHPSFQKVCPTCRSTWEAKQSVRGYLISDMVRAVGQYDHLQENSMDFNSNNTKQCLLDPLLEAQFVSLKRQRTLKKLQDLNQQLESIRPEHCAAQIEAALNKHPAKSQFKTSLRGVETSYCNQLVRALRNKSIIANWYESTKELWLMLPTSRDHSVKNNSSLICDPPFPLICVK